jgi:hypothetical protein
VSTGSGYHPGAPGWEKNAVGSPDFSTRDAWVRRFLMKKPKANTATAIRTETHQGPP